MNDFPISEIEHYSIQRAIAHAKDWAGRHQWELGVAEMALGASILAWGVKIGAIEIGRDIVGSALATMNMGALLGSGIGGGLGTIASAVIGSIGVVGMGTGIAVPAAFLMGAGAAVFSAFGYVAGDLVHKFLQPTLDDLFVNGSLLLVGVALLIDGAQRVIKDQRVIALASHISDQTIRLAQITGKVVVSSLAELKNFGVASLPVSTADAAGSMSAGVAFAAAGTAVSAAVATGSVTVLGSSTLGAMGMSLGLISAPLWPVIAGGAAAFVLGYGTWKGVQHFTRKITPIN